MTCRRDGNILDSCCLINIQVHEVNGTIMPTKMSKILVHSL